MTAQTGMIGMLSTILMGVGLRGGHFNVWSVVGTTLVMARIFMFTR